MGVWIYRRIGVLGVLGVSVYRCVVVSVYRCIGVSVYWVYWCIGVSVYRCIGVSVYRCIGHGLVMYWCKGVRCVEYSYTLDRLEGSADII